MSGKGPRWGKEHLNEGRKRAVEHDCPNQFMGWEVILNYHKMAKSVDKDEGLGFNERELCYVTLFETGCRCSEVLSLRPTQIIYNDEAVKIFNMEVLKHRERVTRDVLIPFEGNPLAERFIELVEMCETRYLLPAHTKMSRTIRPDEPTSRTTVYRRILDISKDIFPHWLRDQRAWQLAAEIEKGGNYLDPYDLKKWFEWKKLDTSSRYAGRRRERELAMALGINPDNIPEVGLKK